MSTDEGAIEKKEEISSEQLSKLLKDKLLPQVNKPGQYLGNEWGARRKSFADCRVRMALAFPDLYELGMSNFGLKILYQLINDIDGYMVDRTYAPAQDMEALLRKEGLPLFAFESREILKRFDLIGFSLQYELTYTNVLNMLDLAHLPLKASERSDLFPLVFGGGPSAVNPEPMAPFLDFFVIGDGEEALPAAMKVIEQFKETYLDCLTAHRKINKRAIRNLLLAQLALKVPGIYAPALYQEGFVPVKPLPMSEVVAAVRLELADLESGAADEAAFVKLFAELDELALLTLPERVLRQVAPLLPSNQPVRNLVPYLALVHDREVLEVRRGCDRGCRFCQPGYTFLPVRERSAEELVELSKQALANSGHEEYSMLSLCVSDYTSLYDSVRALNREHAHKRTSLSFPSQRADRMNLDVAEELKAVRKSGITLAPEAGSEKLRAVINKGLKHDQIINAIESAYESGWQSVKLYFMCGLPFEDDEDLAGIIQILKEATNHARALRRSKPERYRRDIELTCTISNFVPKPFTPFQWFPQVAPEEFARKHQVLRDKLRASGLRNVQLNVTGPQISLLEAVISRGDRRIGEMILEAYKRGAVFDAWDEHFKPELWHQVAEDMGTTLLAEAAADRPVGSMQPYDIVHIGLHHWWLVREWEKAVKEVETAACTENTCHACGICTELETNHVLASPLPIALKKNPFVKELNANKSDPDSHPSLFFLAPKVPVGAVQAEDAAASPETANLRFRLVFQKVGDLKFIGHLDLQNLFIRAFRRAGLEMSYTQGFNPSPKLSFAAPLPLFQEGLKELADIELASPVEAHSLTFKLNRELPPEVQILECHELKEVAGGKKSLASLLGRAKYMALPQFDREMNEADRALTVSEMTAKFESAIEKIMGQEHLLAQMSAPPGKVGSTKDLRPLIHAISVHRQAVDFMSAENAPWLELTLATGSNGHLKPQDLLAIISPDVTFRVIRLELLSQSGESLVPESAKENLELVRGSV
ncbi:MAG TPA: TIGR03936 family radical SAM-associated protein [Candidatus Obscuribacter sp.]|nr:TIGR03936 family radical SAM-associated protein [Candidatus Obscuribacter sp.]